MNLKKRIQFIYNVRNVQYCTVLKILDQEIGTYSNSKKKKKRKNNIVNKILFTVINVQVHKYGHIRKQINFCQCMDSCTTFL